MASGRLVLGSARRADGPTSLTLPTLHRCTLGDTYTPLLLPFLALHRWRWLFRFEHEFEGGFLNWLSALTGLVGHTRTLEGLTQDGRK